MRTVWLVIRHEISVTLRKRSFWILTFLMPAVLLAANTYYVLRDSDLLSSRAAAEADESDIGDASPPLSIGLVDAAGVIDEIPEKIPEHLFVFLEDETAARVALDAREIEQYVYIPADYRDTGEVMVFDRDFQIVESGEEMGVVFGGENAWMLPYLINHNLAGDERLVDAIRNPTPGELAERHRVSDTDESEAAGERPMAQLVAIAMPYIYYFILLISSGYMLQSVTAEKENRTVEVLLVSLHPRQLMVGKILGLTVIVLIQITVWLGGGLIVTGRSASWLNVSGFNFPPGFFIWAVLFLLLGYLLYASVMAAAGTIANTAREGNQVTWILVLPLLPTLMFSRLFLEQPHGTVSIVLSLFPFSAPSAMVTRMAVSNVPLWQIIISLAGLALTTLLFITLAGRFFKAGNLLSTTTFGWRRLITGWRS